MMAYSGMLAIEGAIHMPKGFFNSTSKAYSIWTLRWEGGNTTLAMTDSSFCRV